MKKSKIKNGATGMARRVPAKHVYIDRHED